MRSARRAYRAAQRAALSLFLAGCSTTVVTQPPPEPQIPSYCKQMSKPLPRLRKGAMPLKRFVEEYGRLTRLYMSEAGRADACRRFALKVARDD